MAVTHFVTQFTHVFKHPKVWRSKLNKKCLTKTGLKIWSQSCEKSAYLSTKLILEKNVKKKNTKKNIKVSTIFGGFLGQNIFKTVFYYKI